MDGLPTLLKFQRLLVEKRLSIFETLFIYCVVLGTRRRAVLIIVIIVMFKRLHEFHIPKSRLERKDGWSEFYLTACMCVSCKAVFSLCS